MRSAEATGKTVGEATQKALEELGIDAEYAEVETLEEPSNGLFGLIGSKLARVRVTEKERPENYLLEFLNGIMTKMNLDGDVEIIKDDDILKMNVSGPKMGMLIGKRGQTLNALQYLLNVAYHKRFSGQSRRVILDVEDYREKREETLRVLASNLAKKALRNGKQVILEPMSPQERRIIHTALQDHPDVSTYSQGDEPYRKVVIAPR
ncbi:RNA-binding cell elongation regulator Jag/EloR [Dethiobacter alkaliphilus]|uniref:RNA-binding protein KhpB n=1 Tax=Dethiobacter alkaliphilus AHT 1 TaxID=555088 RepID=C0GI76_DETAL|nr:RNA-binding cell elongation regulator Jag/EloR [Dethiobacter alkaliphilus]EEG76924.1 single-stranded nucleic acid binding R3H domain protein [Dethiobacter alkaliphilus AHT 1]